MVEAYADSDSTQTAGYVVALHEVLMKLEAGSAAATVVAAAEAKLFLLTTLKKERKISERVRVVALAIIFFCGNLGKRVRIMHHIFIEVLPILSSLWKWVLKSWPTATCHACPDFFLIIPSQEKF